MESYSLNCLHLLAKHSQALSFVTVVLQTYRYIIEVKSLAFYCHDNCSRSIMNLNEYPKKRTIINYAFIVYYDAFHYDSCINYLDEILDENRAFRSCVVFAYCVNHVKNVLH